MDVIVAQAAARSHWDEENSRSCTTCRLRCEQCVCCHAPRLSISTRLIVIMHSKEWRRSTNTGHFARLAVQGAEVHLHGSPKPKWKNAVIEANSPSTLVLYPGRGAEPLSPEYVATLARPATLLVPDGNWNQARHMMNRHPLLAAARPVSVSGSGLAAAGLRRNRLSERVSTFEAIAMALGILEGRETEDHLLRFFRHVLDHMAQNSRRCRRRRQVVLK